MKYVRISTMGISPEIKALIEEIRDDRTHGAAELARQAVSVLKIAAVGSQAGNAKQFLTEQKAIGARLISVRPAMAPLYNMVSRLLSTVATKSTEMDFGHLKRFTISEAGRLIEGSIKAVAEIARHISEVIIDGDTLLTHSYSSTVVMALKEAFKKHKSLSVIVTRSGAGRIGEKTAREISSSGIPVTFIDDTAVGLYISQATGVLVGADRICADGSLVNGVGTYPLALVANRAEVPFYVLCEMLKFDQRLKGGEVELEEKDPSEVVASGRLPSGVKVRNPYFDVTPLELITGVLTENGLMTRKQVISYLRKLSGS